MNTGNVIGSRPERKIWVIIFKVSNHSLPEVDLTDAKQMKYGIIKKQEMKGRLTMF
ncbi:hypothetical protein [Paenibacillus sp. FSL H8-0168]|uniref:hypothetical protein n=1 Tax=Paenibacillus sp. FSL H8-0168 TaxID=2921378 RepID=UPI0031586D8F